jgi:hypothetical protein
MADPTRPRIGDDISSRRPQSEADDRFDTTLEEVAEDFASDLLGRLMPRQGSWLIYEPEDATADEVKTAIEDLN